MPTVNDWNIQLKGMLVTAFFYCNGRNKVFTHTRCQNCKTGTETGQGPNKHSASKSYIQAISMWVERQAREKSCSSADLALSTGVVSLNRYCTIFHPGLWSRGRSASNFGWLEQEPNNFEWWSRSRSLNFEFLFDRHSFWSKPIVQIIQWFLVFNGPNRS